VQAQSGLLDTHSGLPGCNPRVSCCFRYLIALDLSVCK